MDEKFKLRSCRCIFVCEQNSRLLVDARAARTYRDELDALRERAMKADKLESEVGRYREQLHKMELYKAKVEVGLICLSAGLWKQQTSERWVETCVS